MRILVINSESVHLGQLQAVCARYHNDVDIKTAAEVTTVGELDSYDVLIIAGAYWPTNALNTKDRQRILDIICSANLPMIGIGLGFELICYAFGVDVAKIGERLKGDSIITPTEEGAKSFQGSDPMRVHETERWSVESEDLPKIVSVLAVSATGVEAIRHKSKPIYGLQLFPEEFEYASDGKLVLENILSSFQKLTKPVVTAA